MIVITNPSEVKNETNIIHSLLEEGLSLLHIRKPDFSETDMAKFLHEIKPEYRNRLVLHSHSDLAEDFGINLIHFSEKTRKSAVTIPIGFPKPYRFTTSTHSIEDFNALENFDYAFLSPVFTSISKENYHPEIDLFEALKFRTNTNVKVIALGGIDSQNIQKTLKSGFDDVALLGAIWNNENPIKQFKLCQKIVRLSLV